MSADNEIRSYIRRGRCVKCGAINNLARLNDENWCFNCLWKRRDALEKRSEAGENVPRELEKVRNAIWILE